MGLSVYGLARVACQSRSWFNLYGLYDPGETHGAYKTNQLLDR